MIAETQGRAVDTIAPAGKGPVFSLSLDAAKPGAPKFSEARMACVQNWIRQKAPECPADVAAPAAEKFLEELQERHPEKFDQLLSPDFPVREFEPALLRQVGARLTGPAQAALREEIARRRVEALLVLDNPAAPASPSEIAGLVEKIKDASQAQHRRLVEGRMEDDDLLLLLRKVRQTGTAPKVAAAEPKVLTAAEIVSEFSRHNQVGASLQRLQAYVVEGRLKTVSGEEQDLLLFRMRPNRFRLVVRAGGVTRYILAADGDRYWQQVPGQPPQVAAGKSVGARRYLAEFCDPLFAGEGYGYERLEDGGAGEKRFHRIAVKRTDGSRYVARIDPTTFREIARENEDKTITRYSDYREVAGVTYAYREEVTDPQGRQGVLELTRITPNPGLIQDFFQPPAERDLSYFQVEQLLVRAPPALGLPKL